MLTPREETLRTRQEHTGPHAQRVRASTVSASVVCNGGLGLVCVCAHARVVHPVLNAEVDATTPLPAACVEETNPTSRHHEIELTIEDVTANVRSLDDHSLAHEACGARIECIVVAAALIDKLEAQAATCGGGWDGNKSIRSPLITRILQRAR